MSVRADASKQRRGTRAKASKHRRGIRAAARIFMAFNFFLHPSFFVSFYTFSRPSHLLLSHSALFLNPLHHSTPFISPFLVICTTVHFSGYTCSHFWFYFDPDFILHIFLYFDFHFSGRTGITYNSLLYLRLDTYHSHSSMASISEDNCLLDFPPHYSSCTILSSPFHFIFPRSPVPESSASGGPNKIG